MAQQPISKTEPPASPAGDWRVDMLARVRALIAQADPHAVEERNWKKPSNPAGVPVWSHCGTVCTGEVYQDKVELTFIRGAALDDPRHLLCQSERRGAQGD